MAGGQRRKEMIRLIGIGAVSSTTVSPNTSGALTPPADSPVAIGG